MWSASVKEGKTTFKSFGSCIGSMVFKPLWHSAKLSLVFAKTSARLAGLHILVAAQRHGTPHGHHMLPLSHRYLQHSTTLSLDLLKTSENCKALFENVKCHTKIHKAKKCQESTNSGRALLRSSAARFNTRPRARGFSSLHSPLLNDWSADFTASSMSAASPMAKVASFSPVAGFKTSPVCPLWASAHLPFNQRPKWGTFTLAWAYLRPCPFGTLGRCASAMASAGDKKSGKDWSGQRMSKASIQRCSKLSMNSMGVGLHYKERTYQ